MFFPSSRGGLYLNIIDQLVQTLERRGNSNFWWISITFRSMLTVGLESAILKVWSSLVDEGVGTIGIHGIGGVGKTTLLKQIYTKLTTSPHDFDTVIWVTASQNLSVEKVQDDIWKRIGAFNVEWVDKSFEEKAKAIHDVLCKRKFVLLLDDLGRRLDLTEVGVADPAGLEEKKCKLIFTTRSEDVCREMGAQATIQMKTLEWEYTWELFKRKVGEDKLGDPKILELAQLIARTCKGLPMLLCTVGRAMASRTTYDEWYRAIKGVCFQVAEEGGKEYVPTLLKLCCDSLDSEAKSCLSYFSLFPEDFTILKNELIDFWICEQILGPLDFEADVLSLGYKTVGVLIGACLLEEEEVNYVKLLDLIRDFARAKLIRDVAFEFAAKNEFSSNHILEIARSREVGQILHMRNSIRNLSHYVPDNFSNFLLNHNPFIMLKAKFNPVDSSPSDISLNASSKFSLNVDASFDVSGFGPKRDLNLWSYSYLESLNNFHEESKDFFPEFAYNSFERNDFYQSLGSQIETYYHFIKAIIVLDLSNTGVEEIPREIAKLVSLEHLNLSRTWINHLPVELKALVKLKCLNLEYADQLRVIPKELISNLFSLQVLKMFQCGYSVEQIKDNIFSIENMDIGPLFYLEHLKVLSITITCVQALDKFFSSRKFLSCTQSLSLEVLWGSKSVDISTLAAMENLIILEIHQVEGLKELNCHPHHYDLPRERSFEKLRQITFDKCSSLLEITWVILVPNLAILKVNDCEEVKEIINKGRMGEICMGNNLEPFGKLEILRLESLSELKSIYWKALPFQYLKKIEVIDCSLLEKLPLDSNSANANEELRIEAQEDWWKNIEWEDDATRATFVPRFKPLFD